MATSDAPLFVPNVTLAMTWVPIGPAVPDPNLPAGNIFRDSFESGDLANPGDNGFTWGNSGNQRYTSLVRMDPATGDPTVVLTSGGQQVYNVLTGDPRDWNAFDGDISMRFDYAAGYDGNVFAEQRWNLTTPGERELWIRFALRVPTNFKHGTRTPSNNKLTTIWMDGYSQNGTGSTLLWEFWGDSNNPGGSRVSLHWNGGDAGVSSGHQQHTKFITYPDDQGRVMYVCFQVVASSAPGAADGEARMWRKWAGEASWTMLHEVVGASLSPPDPASGVDGWKHGYIMGANQSGYDEATEFLVDDFTISTESLL